MGATLTHKHGASAAEWLLEQLLELEAHPTDDCVEWPFSVDTHGYGQIKESNREFGIRARYYLVSRLAFSYAHGILPEGWNALHMCDRPRCFNPAHLFPGTVHMNALDARDKGRTLHGTRNPGTKLTEETVREIRQLYAEGMTRTLIAACVGVGRTQVSRIVDGHHWRRVS